MSEIKTDKLTGVGTAGVIVVTGEGNSTTTNLQQGLAKVWHNQSEDGQTLNGSFNVSSLTDMGTGNYQINVSSNLANATYAGSLTLITNNREEPFLYELQTSSYRAYIYDGAYQDGANTTIIQGDLA